MATLPNQRRFPRYLCDRHVRVIVGQSLMLDGWATDISRGGVGAIVPERILPGEKVTLEMAQAMGQGSLLLNAVVRRQEGAMHGLEFLNVSDVQQRIIRHMCSRPA
jgi:c-di-GMP-binding flagellar brake protein YcgR